MKHFVLAAAGAVLTVAALAPAAHAAVPAVIPADGKIPGQYVVLLNKPTPGSATAGLDMAEQAKALLAQVGGGQVLHVYERVLNGFAVRISAPQAALLATLPLVKQVEQDVVMVSSGTQASPPYGLDRIDQRNLPLNNSYNYSSTGAGVHVYIIDSGARVTHSDFGGRASIGADFVNDGQNGNDCNGHGTHTMGTVGSSTYGVAKDATLVAVRVLTCNNTTAGSSFQAGLEWVAANAIKPAVANASVGTVVGTSSTLDQAVLGLVQSGVTLVVSAGNGYGNGFYQANACDYSPAHVPEVITVSAVDKTDTKPVWANVGSCVDLFAPGVDVISTWHTGDTATNSLGGTSMAAPHVAGAAARYLETNPNATPAQVAAAIMANTTTGVVKSGGTGSPNKLLFVEPAAPVDAAPSAGFSAACTGLSCNFTSTASDDRGIAATSWTFGDGTGGNGPTVSRTYAAAGTYSVSQLVTDTVGQTATKVQSLTVAAEATSPCADCTKVSGSLASRGTAYSPSSSGFSSAGGQFKGHLRGPAAANFDLYLERLGSSGLGLFPTWTAVASSATAGSSENIVYSGGSGTYRWRITSSTGAGSYDFYFKNP